MLIRLFLLLFLQGLSSLMWAHEPLKFLAELEGKADAPQKIYQAYCQSCHDAHPKIPLGAPRAHHSQDWALRLKNKKTLLEHTYEGYQLMPARGGCFECSDKQLVQVIEFMTEKDIKNK